jgi:hypothetical protein
MGAHIATIPYSVIIQLIKHPLTDIGIEKFLKGLGESPEKTVNIGNTLSPPLVKGSLLFPSFPKRGTLPPFGKGRLGGIL